MTVDVSEAISELTEKIWESFCIDGRVFPKDLMKQLLVDNAQPVEFDQPLAVVE